MPYNNNSREINRYQFCVNDKSLSYGLIVSVRVSLETKMPVIKYLKKV